MHILVIEPDILLGGTYSRALEVAGHAVTHARSAQAAIEAADRTRPDMVILELQLPGANGIAFLQEFRSYHEWLGIPVIFHTYVLPHTQRDLRELVANEFGVVAWLYKPQTSLELLLHTLHQHAPAST